jgi:hypothetical protein
MHPIMTERHPRGGRHIGCGGWKQRRWEAGGEKGEVMEGLGFRGLGAVAAACLMACAGAGAAAAARSELVLKTAAGVLAPGAALVMSSTHVLWQTPAARIECSTGELTGTLSSNGAAKDLASFGSVSFGGHEIEGACRSNDLGPAAFSIAGTPWELEMTRKGTVALKGSRKLTATVTFIGRPGSPACTFEAKDLATSLPTIGAVTIAWASELFTRSKKGNASLCPSEATLSASWQLSSGGEALEAEL